MVRHSSIALKSDGSACAIVQYSTTTDSVYDSMPRENVIYAPAGPIDAGILLRFCRTSITVPLVCYPMLEGSDDGGMKRWNGARCASGDGAGSPSPLRCLP